MEATILLMGVVVGGFLGTVGIDIAYRIRYWCKTKATRLQKELIKGSIFIIVLTVAAATILIIGGV